MKLFRFLVLSSVILSLNSCTERQIPVYKNPKYSFETRVDDLVSRMTLEEKVSQLTHYADAIERLDIPMYNWWNECLHGVARAGKATVFPQAIGMAATFDRDMMFRMADVTSTEARAKYHDYISKDRHGMYQGLTFWSPNINIFRDPRWGRGHETYGEDPYLTGEMAVQFIRGLQGDDQKYFKTVATAKHYIVHSGPEPLRHEFDAVTTERDFRDTYLPAFRKSVMDGHVYSVMCAYNRYMEEPCCGSSGLENELLRDELGFEGYVVSDCGAIRDFYTGHKVVNSPEESAALGVESGTDLNCGDIYPNLVKAVELDLISEAEIDIAVKRLMMARMKLGMFDPDDMVPWSNIPIDTVASQTHKNIALEMSRKSIVLLKNENHALPLTKDLKKIAVIGPNADDYHVLLGNYNGSPVDPITVFRGIKDKVGNTAEVRYALGSPHHDRLPYLVPVPTSSLFVDSDLTINGVRGVYYNNLYADGEPVYDQVDPNINFHWFDDGPPKGLEDDNFSIRWTGFLVPEKSGTYYLGVEGKYYHFVFDGDTLISRSNIHHPDQISKPVNLIAGRSYPFSVTMMDRHVDATCILHWEEPGEPLLLEAIQTAAWADHVVLVMGLTARLEGEEMRGLQLDGFEKGDRTTLDLPEVQQQLIKRIYYTGKPVTLVLINGSALSVNWENDHIPALVEAWFPGEQGGKAVADVLFGDYNPGGRLPVTFYKSVNDLPPFEDYNMQNRTHRYFDGEVLYPFGYGLSYTTFRCENLMLDKSEITRDETVTVSIDVTNTGNMDGEEVVQLYLEYPESVDTEASRDLRGFQRVFIPAGRTRTVVMELPAKELAFFDTDLSEYLVKPGDYLILAGASSADEKMLSASLRVK